MAGFAEKSFTGRRLLGKPETQQRSLRNASPSTRVCYAAALPAAARAPAAVAAARAAGRSSYHIIAVMAVDERVLICASSCQL